MGSVDGEVTESLIGRAARSKQKSVSERGLTLRF